MASAELLELCRRAVARAKSLGADEAEAFARAVDSVSSTIEKHDLQISKSQKETAIGVRAFVGRRVGFASTNRIDGLDAACKEAVALARISPEDPSNVLPEPADVESIDGLFDPAASEFSATSAVRHAAELIEETERTDRRVIVNDATFDATVEDEAVASSAGVAAFQRGSLFLYSLVATARDGDRVSSFDIQFGATRRVADIDVATPVRKACENALSSLDAERGESFRGAVLLAPAAVSDILVGTVLFQLNARNSLRGRSRWTSGVGKSVASSSFTLVDDGVLPGGVATSAFDREGVPHRPLSLIEEGRVVAMLQNAYSAHASGTANTAHASGGAHSVPGIAPTNLLVLPGECSSDEMVTDMRFGLLVQRFSGNVDPISGDFSGAVKAARLIQGGKLGRSVSGTMIAGNAFEVLRNISGISSNRELIYAQTLPFIRLEDVSVTA